MGGVPCALLPVVLLASASGCTSQPEAPAAISYDEERQLNDAAAMLDANSLSPATMHDNEADR